MSLETFRQVADLAYRYGEHITLGGGEPTLNPHFEEMLLLAIAAVNRNDNPVLIITNGKLTERALLIARLAKNGVICGELSQDAFHDPIDPKVVEAFGDSIRDVTNDGTRDPGLIAGREIKRRGLSKRPTFYSSFEDICPCDDIFVRPSGRIYQCGCKTSPLIGDASWGYDTGMNGVCYHSQDYKDYKAA